MKSRLRKVKGTRLSKCEALRNEELAGKRRGCSARLSLMNR